MDPFSFFISIFLLVWISIFKPMFSKNHLLVPLILLFISTSLISVLTFIVSFHLFICGSYFSCFYMILGVI